MRDLDKSYVAGALVNSLSDLAVFLSRSDKNFRKIGRITLNIKLNKARSKVRKIPSKASLNDTNFSISRAGLEAPVAALQRGALPLVVLLDKSISHF